MKRIIRAIQRFTDGETFKDTQERDALKILLVGEPQVDDLQNQSTQQIEEKISGVIAKHPSITNEQWRNITKNLRNLNELYDGNNIVSNIEKIREIFIEEAYLEDASKEEIQKLYQQSLLSIMSQG